MKKLEVGRDYINGNGLIVIDRLGDYGNRGFDENNFEYDLFCSCLYVWREAAEEEIIEAFEKHLSHRFGEDWRTMKIKERHPDSGGDINNGLWEVWISKWMDGWNVWNTNGLLYCDGIWVERLEEFEKIHIEDAIKPNTVIHCETESEANRILKMAHELGYNWGSERSFTDARNSWRVHECETCYCIIDGICGPIKYHKNRGYKIINSTEITGMKKSTDWTPAPEDLLVMNNELTITPPSGFEIDEKNSTFQKIVFKKIASKFPTELSEIDRPWYIDGYGDIEDVGNRCVYTPNHFTSKESAEQALKFIKLLAFRDAIWEIEGKPEDTDIDISFNFKTIKGAEHFKKMKKEIELGNL